MKKSKNEINAQYGGGNDCSLDDYLNKVIKSNAIETKAIIIFASQLNYRLDKLLHLAIYHNHIELLLVIIKRIKIV